MPEGPEIRREADRIAAVLAGERLEAVSFGLPRLKRFGPLLTGCRIIALETRGKALLTHFDSGLTMYSHNQLYGRWYVRRRDDLPRTNRSLRVALHTAAHSALLYSASDIDVLDADALRGHPFLRRIGPDLLSADLTGAAVAQRLRSATFCNRAVQGLYLDQSFLAGVGNYLRTEILFHARIHPQARPRRLEGTAIGRLARSTLTIGRRAYRTGGITNPPARVAALRKRGLKRAAHRFAAFARAGEACYRCGGVIERIEATSRRLYWCPDCQRDGT
ncbi:MAG: endonuclease VIII [Pseudomonadales bacterium]